MNEKISFTHLIREYNEVERRCVILKKLKLIACFLLLILLLNQLAYFGDFQLDDVWLYITGTQTRFGEVTFRTKPNGYLEIMIEDELGKRDKTVKLNERQCRRLNERIKMVEQNGRNNVGEDGVQVWCKIGEGFFTCFLGENDYKSDKYLNDLACELLKIAPMRIDLKPNAYMYEVEERIGSDKTWQIVWNIFVTLYGFPWTYIIY